MNIAVCLTGLCLAAVACRSTSVDAWDIDPPEAARLEVPASAKNVLAILVAEFDKGGPIVSMLWGGRRVVTEDSIVLRQSHTGSAGYPYLSPVYHHQGRPLPYSSGLRIRVIATSENTCDVETDVVNPQVLAGSTPHLFHGTNAVFRKVPPTGIEERMLLRTCGEALGIELGPPAVPLRGITAIRELLRSNDETQFRRAMGTLAVLRDVEAIPALTEILAGYESDSTLTGYRYDSTFAAACLGEIGTPNAVPPLVRSLWSYRPEIRLASVRALSRMGADATAAVPELVRHRAVYGDSTESTNALALIARGDSRATDDLRSAGRKIASVSLYGAGLLGSDELLLRLGDELFVSRAFGSALAQCSGLPPKLVEMLAAPRTRASRSETQQIDAALARAEAQLGRIR